MSRKSKSQLVREIRATRERLDDNIDELAHKLSPGELFSRASGFVSNSGLLDGDRRRSKAVPAAIMGLGAAWLASQVAASDRDTFSTDEDDDDSDNPRGRRRLARSYRRGYRLAGPRRYEQSSFDYDNDDADGEDDGMGRRERMRAYASRQKGRAKRRARRAKGYAQEQLQSNPLAVGALAVGLGALVSSLLPPTRREDELFGDYSDDLTERAKSRVHKAYERAKDTVKEQADTSERQGDQSENYSELDEIRQHVGTPTRDPDDYSRNDPTTLASNRSELPTTNDIDYAARGQSYEPAVSGSNGAGYKAPTSATTQSEGTAGGPRLSSGRTSNT